MSSRHTQMSLATVMENQSPKHAELLIQGVTCGVSVSVSVCVSVRFPDSLSRQVRRFSATTLQSIWVASAWAINVGADARLHA